MLSRESQISSGGVDDELTTPIIAKPHGELWQRGAAGAAGTSSPVRGEKEKQKQKSFDVIEKKSEEKRAEN